MPKSYNTLLLETRDQVATVVLNRPEIHNAFNEDLIAELTEAFQNLGSDPEIRVIVLTGSGGSFCAGADLNWMKKMRSYSWEENVADAQKLHEMLTAISRCPKPVLAKVNGPAMGGGLGLIAAADIALAYKSALFALSEARLGLIPAVISPFVIRRMGASRFREYALTAERFSAMQAKEAGLIHHSGEPEAIDELIEIKIQALKAGGPEALAKTKALAEVVQDAPLSTVSDVTSKFLAERRASAEAQEGMDAFFEKRKPGWTNG